MQGNARRILMETAGLIVYITGRRPTMLDKPTPQDTEPVLEALSEEDAYMLSILPLAIQEFEDAINDYDEAARIHRELSVRIDACSEKLRSAGEALRESLAKSKAPR